MSSPIDTGLKTQLQRTAQRLKAERDSLSAYRALIGPLSWFGAPARAQRVRNGYVDLMCRFHLPVFASLTFRDEKRESSRRDVGAISQEQAKTVAMRFLAELDRDLGGGMYGFIAMERQKRGSQHAHVVMWGPQLMDGWEKNRGRLRNEKIEKSWADRAGFSIIEQIEEAQRLKTALYVAKYVAKGGTVEHFDTNDLNEVRERQEEQRALDVESAPCRWVNGTCVEHRCCGLRSRNASHVGTVGRRRYRRKQRYPVPASVEPKRGDSIEQHDFRQVEVWSAKRPAAEMCDPEAVKLPGDSRALLPQGGGGGWFGSSTLQLSFEDVYLSRYRARRARGHSADPNHNASVSRRERTHG